MTQTHLAPSTRSWNRGWSRIDGIDILRGLSILFVLMNHVNMRLLFAKVPYTHGLPDQLVSSLVWNGQFGVQMFFAISGFLITSTSIRRWGSPDRLVVKDFYLLRFARIAPLMLLLLCILSALHFGHVSGYVVSSKTGGLPRALLAALTFHINWLEATRGYLPGNWDILWSLSVEEMFYLFFPLVARVFRRKEFLIPLLVLFAIAGPFARARAFNPNPVWREYTYLGGMDAIALGCLTAILLSGSQLSRTWLRVCGAVGAALLIFSLAFSIRAYAWGLGRNGLNMTVLAVGTCLVIAAAAQSGWRAPRFLAPLLSLGRRSYEIYLTHMFAVMALFAAFVHFGKPLRGVPWLFAACIVTAGLLGWLVAITYAEPMNRRLRKRFGDDASTLGAAQPQVD
ncbi:MAG TPA: acyltransferase [Acidobacteriaceae bacterium]|jgi:peptidoglycan/LPS O-acetylase OafA/YrhL